MLRLMRLSPNNKEHKMNINNYMVTHLESGSARCHAGVSPTALTRGEIDAETINGGYYIPPMNWSPDPTQWRVDRLDEDGMLTDRFDPQ